MSEPTETTETPADETVDLPPLARSITDTLTNLCAHAYEHGKSDERRGEEPGAEMPECLADHVGSLSATLFELARPEEINSTITTRLELPLEVPEGLIEGLQKVVGDLAEKLGHR
ncbi:MAG TPA: hypothetical protein VIP28_06625 [Nocardioides sp.]